MSNPAAGILMLIGGAVALTCYQSSSESADERTLITRDDWKYCGWTLSLRAAPGKLAEHAVAAPSHFGLNDAVMNLTIADDLLSQGAETAPYFGLSYCVYEKFVGDESKAEHLLMCVCARDSCNRGRTLQEYVSHNVIQNL